MMTVGELKQLLAPLSDDEVVGVRVPMQDGDTDLVMLLDVTAEEFRNELLPTVVLVTSKAAH